MPRGKARNKAKNKKGLKRRDRQGSPIGVESVEGDDDGERERRSKGGTTSCQASSGPPNRGPNHAPSTSSTVTNFAPSQFAGANNFTIQSQTIATTHVGWTKTPYDYHVVHSVAHDSKDRRDAPACDENTRIAIRGAVVGWITACEGDEEPKRLMWLGGPAGAGKSAIAGSVAEVRENQGLLAATFFFSSFSPPIERRRSHGLIATLVHHMSQHQALASFRQQVLQALGNRPDIFEKQLKCQAEHLILDPFRAIHGTVDRAGWPKAIIVDGVDEVVADEDTSSTTQSVLSKSEQDQVEVLQTLLTLCRSPYFPFRILVASRPEKNITNFFADLDVQTSINRLFLDSKYEPDADIETFLWARFSQIQRRFRHLGPSWPGQTAVNRIVEMSSGQFIVPMTVIRWIESGIPQRQLEEVLNLRLDSPGSKNPLESLDRLYQHILRRARNPDANPKLVIKWIACTMSAMDEGAYGGSYTPAAFWRMFLEDDAGELDYRMDPISSLIRIPPPDDTFSRITIYHKSLVDYLSTKTRCGDLYINREERDSFVSERIVVILQNRGPRVPPAPDTLDGFLCQFPLLRLVARGSSKLGLNATTPASQGTVGFLGHLSGECLDLLASCDVGWWARLCRQWDYYSRFLPLIRAMYFGIHAASNCKNISERQAQGHPGGLEEKQHHSACTRWRGGILAEARERGWCTHRLEDIPCDELQDVAGEEAQEVLGPSAERKCKICVPEQGLNSDWGESSDFDQL